MLKIFKKIKDKLIKHKQHTFCYCACGNELISSNDLILDDTISVYYKCSKCGLITQWDFDAPTPIFIKVVE